MKKTIFLKQITPMWHFQPYQTGCCLRATEVKPKLDKFLSNLGDENLSKYKIGDTNAYDYKLSFLPTNNQYLSFNDTDFHLYFGNLNNKEKKRLIFYKEKIEMHIFTLHKDLEKIILDNLCDFFATHSFGTRQDKGFGFFFPDENQPELHIPEGHEFNKPHGAEYQITVTLKLDQPMEDMFSNMFKNIELFHCMIRSGIQYPTEYTSFMFHYANSKDLQWDKTTICKYFKFKNYNDSDNKKNKELYLFRDALGLASVQEWKTYNEKIHIEVDADQEGKKDFTRFKSPILYRPCINKKDNTCTIYLHLNNTSINDIKGKKFKITHEVKKAKGYKKTCDEIKDITIYEYFNLNEYFDYIINSGIKLFQKEYEIKKEKKIRIKKNAKKEKEKKINNYLEQIFLSSDKNEKMGFHKIK